MRSKSLPTRVGHPMAPCNTSSCVTHTHELLQACCLAVTSWPALLAHAVQYHCSTPATLRAANALHASNPRVRDTFQQYHTASYLGQLRCPQSTCCTHAYNSTPLSSQPCFCMHEKTQLWQHSGCCNTHVNPIRADPTLLHS